jgi:SAM-dependent methyltransferase
MNNRDRETYHSFAEIYDEIMCGVDYEAWADYVESLLELYNKKPRSLVDLACGTGSSTLPFARRGYQIAGVDLSKTMLEKARFKTEQCGLDIKYYQDDLRTLKLPGKYDLALLFQDGLNYLLSPEELAMAMKTINCILKPGSLFIFDLTRPKLRGSNADETTEIADLDSFTLIWKSSYDQVKDIWSLGITVFQQLENGLYRKFCEEHREKDYTPGEVQKVLTENGFSLLGLYRSFTQEKLKGSESKITFIAEKN